MTARAPTVIITETEAVRGANSFIAGQLIHTRHTAFPGGHCWCGNGGGKSGAEQDEKRETHIKLSHLRFSCHDLHVLCLGFFGLSVTIVSVLSVFDPL